ncbi:hypothetical protein PILCRDRAFT_816494 [Piloderma croceum F 1598]|uniref:Uncharacterized protein n=1 Tax=Piloderma croceum (strain F 1598) TaxID=765440 RepID=A0A0C3FPD0_PILCF|nr:hypothetical protein PILCRDRAFT_816494 [Piloderma croceum F 1598]
MPYILQFIGLYVGGRNSDNYLDSLRIPPLYRYNRSLYLGSTGVNPSWLTSLISVH